MRIPKLEPLTPILVEAVDLTTHQNWRDLDHVLDANCLQVQACGLYVSHDKDVIRLTQMVSHDGEVADGATETLVIPLGVVKKVRKLK